MWVKRARNPRWASRSISESRLHDSTLRIRVYRVSRPDTSRRGTTRPTVSDHGRSLPGATQRRNNSWGYRGNGSFRGLPKSPSAPGITVLGGEPRHLLGESPYPRALLKRRRESNLAAGILASSTPADPYPRRHALTCKVPGSTYMFILTGRMLDLWITEALGPLGRYVAYVRSLIPAGEDAKESTCFWGAIFRDCSRTGGGS